ncbi:MAG: hypothetical protein JWR15_2055 [Prosthecobacter sp.]|nr:hypothetical protein [Prosthecobacter sp.]
MISPATRSKISGLTLALIVTGMSCCSNQVEQSGNSHAASSREAANLRIGTYNLYVGAHDLPQTVAVLKRMDADVIALQEVRPDNAQNLYRAFAAHYPHRYFSSAMGLLSRYPLRHPNFQRSQRGINGFLFAEIDHPQGRLQVANIHLDPLRLWTGKDILMLPFQFGRNRSIQRDELLQVFGHLNPSLPTLLVGDFNRVSDDVIHKLQRVGFTDSFADVTKNADHISTLHFSFLGIHFGRRIDFIFHDRNFHTILSEVIHGKPSDHDALVSGLVWNRSITFR